VYILERRYTPIKSGLKELLIKVQSIPDSRYQVAGQKPQEIQNLEFGI
jgi:hypothetical protein